MHPQGTIFRSFSILIYLPNKKKPVLKPISAILSDTCFIMFNKIEVTPA